MGRLFWKFFLSILLAQLAATAGVGAAFWLRDQARAKETAPSAIDTGRQAEFILDATALTLRHGGIPALRELIEGATHHSILVIDDSGHELLGRTVTPALLSEAERLLGAETRHNVVRRMVAPDGSRFLVFVKWFGGRGGAGGPPPGMAGEPGPGPGFGQLPPPGRRGGPLGRPPGRELLPYMMMIGATLASLVFAALLAWYFSRPIRALRGAFEAAAGGDLKPRFASIKGVAGDELNDLGRDFDRMSAQLRALMDGQRRLLHDVSHELRSPLARLQAAIGLAHQRPDKIGASLERIERESVRMDKLVGELLTLSRLEASAALPANEEIAFMDMVEEIVDDARFEAQQSNRSIAISGVAIVAVRGSPDLLWRAIENVVRNAIKHSPDGGIVKVDVGADAERVRLSVLDRGPGVAPEDLEAIFQPFYRSNAASNNVDGHGLGLAIALRVIDAHGGTIDASNREGGGLCVSITLPLAS